MQKVIQCSLQILQNGRRSIFLFFTPSFIFIFKLFLIQFKPAGKGFLILLYKSKFGHTDLHLKEDLNHPSCHNKLAV